VIDTRVYSNCTGGVWSEDLNFGYGTRET